MMYEVPEQLLPLLVPPEDADANGLKLVDKIIALLSSQRDHFTTKMAALNLAKANVMLYNTGCEWQDMTGDAWAEYCIKDACGMSVLLDGAREQRVQRKAKETIDMVTRAITRGGRDE